MPGGDRTGPRGRGPRTGRGLGYCNDDQQPGYVTPQPGQRLGLGFRRGFRGRGWRNRFNTDFWWGRGAGGSATLVELQDQDIDSLKAQTQELQNVLQQIQERLNKLEA